MTHIWTAKESEHKKEKRMAEQITNVSSLNFQLFRNVVTLLYCCMYNERRGKDGSAALRRPK